MRKYWIPVFGVFALTLTLAGRAEAVLPCPGGVLNVDTLAEAADLCTNGFLDNACDLTISVGCPGTTAPDIATNLSISAASITIQGPDAVNGTPFVNIINDNPNSETRLDSDSANAMGDIVIDQASIKAHSLLVIDSDADIIVTASELIASTIFGPPPAGNTGDLRLISQKGIDVTGTSVHGGGIVEWRTFDGDLKLICQPNVGGCQDPTTVVPTPAIVAASCGDPAVFPCNLALADADDLRAVCIQPGPQVTCNGGHKEKRFTVDGGDAIFENSKIDSERHFTIAARDGCVRAAGMQLTVTNQNVTINAGGACLHDPSQKAIDLAGASIFAKTTIRGNVTGPAASACPTPNPADPATLCIDATGADFTAKVTPPRFNGDNTSPYDPNVADTAAECTVLGGFGPVILSNPNLGDVALRTPANSGLISVCDAMVMPVP